MGTKQVWILEDNASDVYLIHVALEKMAPPFEVTMMTEGEQALRTIEQVVAGSMPPPDLLLLDLHLPRTDGTTLLELVQTSPPFSGTCVAVISSLPEPYGFNLRSSDHYIRKSPHLTDFVRSVASWVASCIEKAA